MEGRCHQRTKAKTAPERLPSEAQLVFSFCTLKPQGGMGKHQRFYRSFPGSEQVIQGITVVITVILPGHSLPGGQRTCAWQVGDANNALSKSLNSQHLKVPLFYFIML